MHVAALALQPDEPVPPTGAQQSDPGGDSATGAPLAPGGLQTSDGSSSVGSLPGGQM